MKTKIGTIKLSPDERATVEYDDEHKGMFLTMPNGLRQQVPVSGIESPDAAKRMASALWSSEWDLVLSE
jgi:hypothetical protein